MTAVRTVVFDVGMTLLRITPSYAQVFAAGAADAGLEVDPDRMTRDRDGFGQVYVEHATAWKAAGEPSPNVGDADAEARFWRGLYRRYLELLGVEVDHEAIAAAIHERFQDPTAFEPHPDVEPTLAELERLGVTLAILSNWGPSLRDMLEHHGLAGRFATIVISGEEGVAKPDHTIFRRTLERLGEEPGPHVAYVGDDVDHDVAPAAELGLTPVLIDRWDLYPDHAGHRLTDLRQLVDRLTLVQGSGR